MICPPDRYFFPAAVSAGLPAVLASIAQDVIAAADLQIQSIYNAFRNLFPGASIDSLGSSPGDIHLRGALLLSHPFQVDQTYRLELVQGHKNRGTGGISRCLRSKLTDGRKGADPPSFTWSGHRETPPFPVSKMAAAA